MMASVDRLSFVSCLVLCLLSSAFCLLAFVLWPELDLLFSGFFASKETGFVLRDQWILIGFEKAAFWGARALVVLFVLFTVWSLIRKKAILFLSAKSWFFLLVALLVGPGLVANVVFKDHWGRARPREIVAFGGTKVFTPALVMSDQCKRNCSFVSGDGAFGFFLPCLAYVVPLRRSRKVLAATLGVGALFGLARILLGAHFLSDVLFAAFFMTLTNAALHALFFSAAETKKRWRVWFSPVF